MGIKKYYYAFDKNGKEHDESFKLETFDEKILRLRALDCKELHVQYYDICDENFKERYLFTIVIKF